MCEKLRSKWRSSEGKFKAQARIGTRGSSSSSSPSSQHVDPLLKSIVQARTHIEQCNHIEQTAFDVLCSTFQQVGKPPMPTFHWIPDDDSEGDSEAHEDDGDVDSLSSKYTSD